ncbi:MAG: 4-hydroxybutyrate CoA-transferase [Anaerolinea sp.]|nr:4-hydroxybutyrate CoA-transferase [Anaerolinea sp.]
MDWKKRYAEKLISVAEGAKLVQSGQRVWVGMFTSTPESSANQLLARAKELKDVEISHYVSPFLWATPETAGHFRLVTAFSTPADRGQVHAGMADYLPLGNFRQSSVKEAVGTFDVAFIKTSPPDENGFLSMGTALWANRTALDVSRQIVCEVDERLIRTYGENYIHMSEVAALVEHNPADDREAPIPPRSQEVIDATEIVGTILAAELINDGDTLQIGIGDVTSALALFLTDKHDLGIQTELIPGGIADLVDQGVVTGKYKSIAPGKVVGAAFAVLPPEEAARVHMNPKFELWDFCHTDDLRILCQQKNFVAINNALQLDLSGQVTAESLGGKIFSGPGGQTVFAVAASYCEGGRSIIALPSASTVNGVRQSRILSSLAPGSTITVPRTYVDYVVTEQGIARLTGKTLRQRCDELISVAHPDFQPDLRAEAKALFNY